AGSDRTRLGGDLRGGRGRFTRPVAPDRWFAVFAGFVLSFATLFADGGRKRPKKESGFRRPALLDQALFLWASEHVALFEMRADTVEHTFVVRWCNVARLHA